MKLMCTTCNLVTVIIGFILLVVKILYLIDWIVFYSSLLGQRVRESERMIERENRPIRYGNSVT